MHLINNKICETLPCLSSADLIRIELLVRSEKEYNIIEQSALSTELREPSVATLCQSWPVVEGGIENV